MVKSWDFLANVVSIEIPGATHVSRPRLVSLVLSTRVATIVCESWQMITSAYKMWKTDESVNGERGERILGMQLSALREDKSMRI